MAVLALDLGGTKLAAALYTRSGELLANDVVSVAAKKGGEVGQLIADTVLRHSQGVGSGVDAIGVSVPGIARAESGTVWAPNIPGWDDYPLVSELSALVPNAVVVVDSDRACSMLGEVWQGKARGCRDAVFLAVGTGIGAGILCDGRILRGAQDIAGSVGWLALDKPFQNKYISTGCFEYYASGDGIARLAREFLAEDKSYDGVLRQISDQTLTARQVFDAYEQSDALARRVFDECIQYWGMAAANLISIFNPEKIIFGGGVFGPAVRFLEAIRDEARKWAQPISMGHVTFEASALQGTAAIYGAAFLALQSIDHEIV